MYSYKEKKNYFFFQKSPFFFQKVGFFSGFPGFFGFGYKHYLKEPMQKKVCVDFNPIQIPDIWYDFF